GSGRRERLPRRAGESDRRTAGTATSPAGAPATGSLTGLVSGASKTRPMVGFFCGRPGRVPGATWRCERHLVFTRRIGACRTESPFTLLGVASPVARRRGAPGADGRG